MTKTNFFTELHAALGEAGASMSITPAGDVMTISFLPNHDKKADLSPLTLPGSPADFGEEFFANITRTVNKVREKGLIANHEEVEKSIDNSGSKKSSTKGGKETKKAPAKPVDKKYQGLVKRSTPELQKLLAEEETPAEVKKEAEGIIEKRNTKTAGKQLNIPDEVRKRKSSPR